MAIDDGTIIDVIVRLRDDRVVLVIQDNGEFEGKPTQRLKAFREKLRIYANYLSGPEFRAEYPDLEASASSIQVITTSEPTPEMAEIGKVRVAVTPKGSRAHVEIEDEHEGEASEQLLIPVEFILYRPDEDESGEKDPLRLLLENAVAGPVGDSPAVFLPRGVKIGLFIAMLFAPVVIFMGYMEYTMGKALLVQANVTQGRVIRSWTTGSGETTEFHLRLAYKPVASDKEVQGDFQVDRESYDAAGSSNPVEVRYLRENPAFAHAGKIPFKPNMDNLVIGCLLTIMAVGAWFLLNRAV